MKLSRRRKTHRKQQRKRGGGYSENLGNMLYHGGPENKPYGGPGYDCAGVPVRPGTITNISSAVSGQGGLPGLSGGGVTMRRRRQQNGGRGNMGGPITTGATQVLNQLAPAEVLRGGRSSRSNRSSRSRRSRKQQKGGRWGAFPDLGPLNPTNAVGMSGYSPILRQPCEIGTRDALNLNPNGVQSLSTYVSSKGIAGWTQTAGGKQRRTRRGKASRRGRKQQGGAALMGAPLSVSVGDVDAMRYYAPTAGYSNAPLSPPVANNPGILMQLGYPARHFNEACMNTK